MGENYIFYERLMKSIEQSGKSINYIERELGYSRNALHNYKDGTEPSGRRLVKLAKYFNLSPEYLIGETDDISSTCPEIIFYHLSERQKREMLKVSQEWGYSKIVQSEYK